MSPTTYENDEETLSEGYSLEEVYPETGEYQEEDFSEDDQDSEYYDDSAEDDDQDAEYYDDTGEEEEDGSPAVVMPKKKNFFMRHIVWFIILIVLIIAAIVAFTVVIPRIKAAKALKNVKAPTYEVLEKRNIANSVAVTGTIKAKESRTVSTLVTNTKVVSVSVEVGDYVKAGQEICVFDKENLQTKIDNLEKQMNVATAKSNETVTNAQVDVNKANTNLANDFVDNTTSVARLQQSYDDAVRDYHNACDGFEDAKKTRDEAKNTLNNVEGNYNNAKSRYDPLPDLVKSGAAEADETQNAIMKDYTYWSQQYSSAKSAYDSAASKVTQYETNIQSAEQKVRKAGQELDDAKLKTDRTLISDASNVATSELSQSTKNIEATTTNDSNREQMDSYKTQLDGYVITAPISGIVTSLSVSVGDEFSNNSKTEVCVIQDDSEWIVEGNVEQYDVSNIVKGMKAVVKTDATGDEEMDGEVTFISPVPASSSSSSSGTQGAGSSGSATSASYPIKIKLAKRDDRIRIGMTAETSVIMEQAVDVFAVPYDCIKEKGEGNYFISVEDLSKASSDSPADAPSDIPSDAPLGPPSGRPSGATSAAGSVASTVPSRDIPVKKGLETDYYTEIISDELKEGMKVIIPEDSDAKNEEEDIYGVYFDDGPGGDGPDGPPPEGY